MCLPPKAGLLNLDQCTNNTKSVEFRTVFANYFFSLDTILKSRDITLLIKVRLVKAMVFPVVVYGCESWTVNKAECWRIDAFELWCWRRLLRVLWTARRSKQSILKEISLEYLLEGLMLKLKDWSWNSNTLSTWCKYLTHWKRPWCGERLKAGREGDDRE